MENGNFIIKNGRIFQKENTLWSEIGRKIFTKMAIYTRSVNLIMENKTEVEVFSTKRNKRRNGNG
jgi:hypothetical protein